MFKGIKIELTGPICQCEKQDLIWGIFPGPGLRVICQQCEVRLEVPHKEFKASFAFDVKYPAQREVKTPELKIVKNDDPIP